MTVELTCQELVELVTDYLEQALPPDERIRFEQHLSDCDECRNYLDQMRRTVGVMRRLTEDSIPPATRDELLRAFRDWKKTA